MPPALLCPLLSPRARRSQLIEPPSPQCLATSADGLSWVPYNGGRPPSRDVAANGARHCEQLPACCGQACRAAADTLNCFYRHNGSDWVINRKNFGTDARWRETRGVRFSANPDLRGHFKGFVERRSWYLDRLGKEERYQRQIYSMSVTHLGGAAPLKLGLLTVIEWPKVDALSKPHPMPPHAHDFMSVYLLSSRDGLSWDLSSLYSHSRLVPRGTCRPIEPLPNRHMAEDHVTAASRACDFDHGYVQPASEIVTSDDGRHHLYYEGRPVQHEDRWRVPARIAVATWQPHRLVALSRPPTAPQGECALVGLRPFLFNGSSLTLNADVSAPGALLSVDVHGLSAAAEASAAEASAAEASAAETSGSSGGGGGFGPALLRGRVLGDGHRLRVQWHLHSHSGALAPTAALTPKAQLAALRGRLVRLRLRLCGAARLYAFTVTNEEEGGGRSDAARRVQVPTAADSVSSHSRTAAAAAGHLTPTDGQRRLGRGEGQMPRGGEEGRQATRQAMLPASVAVFSYAPHSGQSNQLFALLSAVHLAHAVGVRLLLPPLLLGKTIGPACGKCVPREHEGGPPSLQRHVAPLSALLNLSALQDVAALQGTAARRARLHHDSPNEATAGGGIADNGSGVGNDTIVRLCHFHRGGNLRLVAQEVCETQRQLRPHPATLVPPCERPKPIMAPGGQRHASPAATSVCAPDVMRAIAQPDRPCDAPRVIKVPIACLRAFAEGLVAQRRVGTTTHAGTHAFTHAGTRGSAASNSAAAATRVHLQFGSLYQLVHGAYQIERAPLRERAPPELRFNVQVVRAAEQVVAHATARAAMRALNDGPGLASEALTSGRGRLACAHLRTGHGAWDVVPTFFANRASTVLRAFAGWLRNTTFAGQRRRRHVLLLLDDPAALKGLPEARSCLARGQCSLVEDHLKATTDVPVDAMHLVAAVSQEACSAADELLLTRGSSFSALIELLWNRRTHSMPATSRTVTYV